MPRYEVEIPGKGKFEVDSPEPLTDQQAYAAAIQQIGAGKVEKPATGILAAGQKGLESLISSGRTAFEALTGSPEEAARRGLERGEDLEKRIADQVSLERVKKAYEERGLLPAAGEVARQVPLAIAEQAPNIAATLGSARAGAALGAMVPIPGAAFVGGALGAVAPSLIQQFGGNIERQAVEQQKRGAPVQIERGAAAAAAVPQAALDVAGTFIPLGGRMVSKLTGIPVKALLGRSAAQVQKLAEERLLTTLAKGTAVGAVAEIPTEIAQQMLERAQAGLPLTTPDALKEYGETAYQVGLLAPIGAAGRVAERAGARSELQEQQALEQARVRAQQRAAAPEVAAPEAAAPEVPAPEAAIPEPTLRTPAQPPVTGEAEAAPELTPLQQYAAQKIAEVNARVEKPLNKDYLAALMSDPALAWQLVAQQVTLPGFKPQRSTGLLGALELQLRAKQGKEAKELGAVGTAAAQQRLAGVEEEEAAALEAQRAEEERARKQAAEQSAEAAREQRIAPEVAGIQRLGKITTPKGEYFRSKADEMFRALVQRGIDEKNVEDLVNTLPLGESYTPTGQVVYGAGINVTRARNDAVSRYRIAKQMRNREAMKEAMDEWRALGVKRRGATGELTRDAAQALNEQFGIRTPDNLVPQKQAEALADKQNALLVELLNTLEFGAKGKLTRANVAEVSTGPKIQQLREQFLQAHLAELEQRKAAYGLPAMLDWERGEAQARVNDALNRIINRWGKGGSPMPFVRELQNNVRQSITNILNNAIDRDRQRQKTEIEQKTGPATDKYYFRDAEGNIIPGKTMEVPRRPEGPRIAPPQELKLREQPRMPEGERETAVKILDQVLSTAERRTRAKPTVTEKPPTKVKGLEGLGALFKEEKTGAEAEKLSPELVRFAQRLRNELEVNTDPEFAAVARETAQQIMEGNIPSPDVVREINDMMRARAQAAQSATRPGAAPEELQRTSAAPQLSLFGEVATERATPANFQRLLDSKDVQGLRDNIARIKADNKAALERARGFTTDIQKDLKRAVKELQKARERLKELQASVDKAKVTYKGVRAKPGEPGTPTAKVQTGTVFETTSTGEPEWFAPAVRKVVELESYIGTVPMRIDYLKSIQKQLRGLDKQARQALLQMAQQAHDKELVDLLQRGALSGEIKQLTDLVNNAKSTIGNARKTLDNLLKEWNKGAVIREALAREMAQAEARVGRAEEKVRKATRVVAEERKAKEAEAEAEAEKIKTPEAKWRAALQRGREGLNLPGIRVEKDTSGMKRQIAEIRSAMGSLDEQISAATDPAEKAELQAKFDEQSSKLERVYADAPRITTELKAREQLEFEQAFDDAQAAAYDKAAAKRRGREQEPAPTLPRAKKGPLVSDTRTRQKKQSGYKQSISDVADKALQDFVNAQNAYDETATRINNRLFEDEAGISEGLTAQAKKARDQAQKNDIKALQLAERSIADARKRMQSVAQQERETYAALRAYRKGIPEDEEQRFARGVEVSSPDLTADQVRMLQRNDIVGALRSIAEDKNASTTNRAVAQRLASMLDATDIKLVKNLKDDKGQPALGRATSKLVELDANFGVSQEILLHEATHAAVERVLQLPEDQLTDTQRIARRELQALFNAVKNDPRITSVNAKASLSEFAAEVMSNSNLQKQLSAKKWRLADAWQGFKSIIMRLLGVEKPETMLGAALQSVDVLMIPSSMRVQGAARPKRVLSQKDIAALHTGSNSMRQFAEQFGPLIKQKDRTPEDAERIAQEVFDQMYAAPGQFVAVPTENSLDYEGSLVMSDGNKFDPDNPLHLVEASVDTLVAYEAKSNPALRREEARRIKSDRLRAFNKLTTYLDANPAYTRIEQALVAKAASKYGVVSDRSGKLKLVNIDENNRHQIAVVGHDAANAVIEELRAGKPLKEAFLTGLQKIADSNAQKNTALQGWAKFDQANTEEAAKRLNAGAAGTPWCTGASVNTARRQISEGDFYIYYQNGRPEVAVRMDGDNRIGEIRGNSSNQALNETQQKIAEDFLRSKQDTFVGVDDYLNEVERRKALLDYYRSPSESTLRGVMKNLSSTGAVRDHEVTRMFRFYRLDGYASLRPEPSDAVVEKLRDQINEERVKAVLEGDLSGLSAAVIDKAATEVEVSFGGKTYNIPLNKIKRIGELRIYAGNGRQYDLSSLIDIRELIVRADHVGYGKRNVVQTSVVQIPNLKKATRIKWGTPHADSVPVVIEVPSTAIVDTVFPADDNGSLEIRGLTQARLVAAVPDLPSELIDHLLDRAEAPKAGNLVLPDLLYAQTEDSARVPFYLTSLAAGATTDALSFAKKDNKVTFTDLYSADKFAEMDKSKQKVVAESIDGVFDFVNRALGNKLTLPKGKDVVEKFIDDIYKSGTQPSSLYTHVERDAATDAYNAAHAEAVQYAADGDYETAVEMLIDAGYLPERRVTMVFTNIRGYIGAALFNATSDAYPDLDADTARKINQQIAEAALEDKVARNDYLNLATLTYQDYTLSAPNRVGDMPPAQAQQTELFPYAEPEEQPRYAKLNPELKNAVNVSEALIRREKFTMDKLRASGSGLAFETYVVDRFAGLEKMRKYMPELKGMQMSFYLRMYDQRMNFVSQSVSNGALDVVAKNRKDGETEYLIESVKGPSVKSVVQILKGAKPLVGDADAVNRLFTLYMTALRAEREGYKKLGLEQFVTEAQIKDAMKDIKQIDGLRDVFEEARQEYNDYNKNQINFLEKTGAISKKIADELRAKKDYIPWYRAGRDGAVEFMLGDDGVFTVGNLKDQPYLHELIGDNRPIFDFLTSSVQNTNMIVDMGLNNIATKNAVFELVEIGAAKITGKISGPDVVRFKDKGEDKYAVIETDAFGVPADLLVKGMAGIPRQVTGMMRMISIPSQLLRKAVTLNPLYPAKQLFRDSLAAPILAGANFTPVAGALREIGSAAGSTLERRGIVGGQYFTGTQEDLSMILRDVLDGKSGIGTLISKAEALGMEADALTRRAQYNSYIKQGLSEMEATLMALESMNFNKRGASASMHTANALIPFFNAQIQSLNVLYKALTGQMPLNDRLKIREKLFTRGLVLMAGTLAYAALMSDDEAYKNAMPDQKYGYWFIRLPGVEEPLRLPIPFEIGYIFKALPEALYNTIRTGDSDEAKAALEMILRQVTPGGSSMPVVEIGKMRVPLPLPVPQFAKPALEAALEKSFYTGRDILSAKEKKLLPEAQYRETTTEVAKALGGEFGVSPIKIDALINGYTSALGIAALHAVGVGMSPNDSPEKAAKRLSEMPIVGGAFQPNDAGWAINRTYDLFKEDMQVKQTVKDYIARGERSKAMELLQQRSDQLAMAEFGNTFEQTMRKLTQYETAIRASDRSPEEKRRLLDELRQTKIRYAEMVREQSKVAREAYGRTTAQ